MDTSVNLTAQVETISVTYFVAIILGVLSSLIVAMFVEWMRKPRLKFSILPPEKVGLFGSGGILIDEYIALKVLVSNEPLPVALRWMQRQSARDCRATLHFLRDDGTEFINRKMAGRWAGSVQPVPIQGSIQPGNGVIEIHDIARLMAESRIHIPAGESEGLDVAVRYPDSEDAFGWTNESYRHEGRHPDFCLPNGRYLVDICIHSEGVKEKSRFRVENDHNIDKFRLIMLSRADLRESDTGNTMANDHKNEITPVDGLARLLFSALQWLTLWAVLRLFLKKKWRHFLFRHEFTPEEASDRRFSLERSWVVDTYVLLWFVGGIAGYIWICSNVATPLWRWIFILLACIRLIETIQSNVNISVFDFGRGRTDNQTASASRLLVLAFMNIAEFVLWFAIIYALNIKSLSHASGKIDALYFSIMTQFTVGYGDIKPLGEMKWATMFQVLFGFVHVALVVATAVNTLPRMRGLLDKSKGQNSA